MQCRKAGIFLISVPGLFRLPTGQGKLENVREIVLPGKVRKKYYF